MSATSDKSPGSHTESLMVPKEISWLAFNERVLQEAESQETPAIERIRYLGIFSNNLDEFFRVRVADLRRLVNFSSGKDKEKNEALYKSVQDKVVKLQNRFDAAYHDALRSLAKHHIYLIDESQIKDSQSGFITDYFRNHILPVLRPIIFADPHVRMPQLSDTSIYFAVKINLENNQTIYSILEIPSPPLPRFIVIPSADKTHDKVLIVIENIIRYCLKDVFRGTLPIKDVKAYTFKLTRDAEIEIGEGISQSIIDKMTHSLKKRKSGDPVRFVYDREMPEDLLAFLVKQVSFGRYDSLIAGGRYHNFKDFLSFPNLGTSSLEHRRRTPIPYTLLKKSLMFDAIRQKDILLHFPYHSFINVENLLHTAALDPAVRSIKITLYRLASDSHIASALINAVQNQKEVTVVMELQARFDEQANIHWANQLTEAGVNVIFGVPGLKVHSKLVLISRMEGNAMRYYTHIGTGNFNEKTARIYTDFSLLTAHQEIGQEVANVFEFIRYNYKQFNFKHLLFSPYSFRSGITGLIEQEIINARNGLPARITIKCNNIVDKAIIEKLYEASQAGVKIRMIIRGMISLIPGKTGLSENIEAVSIVDRYLEHARVYIFENNGSPKYYIASADLMTRNLDHRVEVACPVYDGELKSFVQEIIDTQWADTKKARVINADLNNALKSRPEQAKEIRSQEETYKIVAKYSKH